MIELLIILAAFLLGVWAGWFLALKRDIANDPA